MNIRNFKTGKYIIKPNLKCAHPECDNILGLEQSRSAKYCSPSCASRDRVVWNKGLINENAKHAYKRHKKDCCERCGFIPEDPCQLDVDHKDGNHKNADPNNLQTLCANCHRLKSKRNKDTSNHRPSWNKGKKCPQLSHNGHPRKTSVSPLSSRNRDRIK